MNTGNINVTNENVLSLFLTKKITLRHTKKFDEVYSYHQSLHKFTRWENFDCHCLVNFAMVNKMEDHITQY